MGQTVLMSDDGLLAEQRAFYRVRAPEYDEWWQRRGRYDHGGETDRREWNGEVEVVEAALAAFAARGAVLELAGGTGWWTERLARTATRLTVVDASPETLALNRQRVQRPDVEYVVADLFSWQPSGLYDVVFFSFWLSHVPRDRFGEFWRLVGSCVAPHGRAFLVDSRADPAPPPAGPDPIVVGYGPDLQRRRLNDGSEYRVVKVLYEPPELQALIEREGWRVDLGGTRRFIFGWARPDGPPR